MFKRSRIAGAGVLAWSLIASACSGGDDWGTGSINENGDDAVNGSELTGNGAPNGAHFTLNLLGVSNPKKTDMSGNNGSRIFLPLTGSAKIMLSEGPFQVLDANGTDGSASFQLPSPDPDNDGTTSYSVYARALGKPGGRSTTTTCATDVATGEEWCSVYSSVMVRESGRSRFENVSRELLYVYADTDGDGTLERYPLFDDRMQDYFWQYDNQGLKLVQLRFYEVPTTVPAQ